MRSCRHWIPALALVASCDGGVTDSTVVSIAVAPADAAVVPDGTITLRADVRDADGRRLANPIVQWTTSSSGDIVGLRPGGVVAGVRLGGPVTVRAGFGGRSDSVQVSVVTSGSARVDEMLTGIDEFVTTMLQHNLALLPLNPQLTEPIQRKVDMLQRPELSSRIVRGLYAEGVAVSGDRTVPIVVLFAADTMRDRVDAAMVELARALPVLESFMGTPLSTTQIRVWYGFALGSRGGGGSLFMEDQGTYDGSRTGDPLPYAAILDHELAHSWIGHESLTQFLELYVYNFARTGSTDVADWVHTRGHTPDDPDNTGVHAILDIHRIIGHAAMADAYGALHALRPPYGMPLSAEARAAIIERAPPERQAEVAAKVDSIGL